MSEAAGKAPTDARPSVLRGRPAIKGLPKGVSGPLPKGGKFQARVTHKPSGISQRHLGLFDTVEEAEAAISGAVEDLIAGSDPASLVPLKTPPPPVSSIQSLRAMARSAAAACGQIVSSPSALRTRIVAMGCRRRVCAALIAACAGRLGPPRISMRGESSVKSPVYYGV